MKLPNRVVLIAIFFGIASQSFIIKIATEQTKSGFSRSEGSGESSRLCECWIWPTCISNCTSISTVKVIFESEHDQISKLKTPFIVLIPYQARKQKQKKIDTSTLNKQGHYRMDANFWVHLVNGEDLQLSLHKSRIFGDESKNPNNHLLKYYQTSNAVVSNTLKKCFYTGTVLRDQSENAVSHSYVAIDTCDGLRGIILYKGIVYGIIPMKHSKSQTNGPVIHFIYPETTTAIERIAGNLKTFWHINSVVSDKIIGNEKLLHIIPVSIVVDNTLMKLFNHDIDTASHFAISLVNFITKSFMFLKQIQIELAKVELWNIEDRSLISKSIKATLNEFLKYQLKISENSSNRAKRNGEVTILLSGLRFTEDVEYIAIPDSICTKRAVSVVQVTSLDQIYRVSRLMSLVIAENFGINSFLCPDNYECTTETVLSKGDESRFKLALLSGQANCLKSQSSIDVNNTCGNRKLDRGEECDLNILSESSDSLKCCDRLTCLVRNYAECNGGTCCSSNCTFYPRGRYCRPSRDQCDIPEFCSGDNGSCPKDLFLENGQPCNQGSALCYQGRCPTRDNKCKSLWSGNSKDANINCYSTFNLKFEDSCGSQRKCTNENQMCGYLYCQGGSEFLSESVANSVKNDKIRISIITTLQVQQSQIQCKYLDNHEHSYVEDGTECGTGKYCFGNTCTSGHSKIISKCPKESNVNSTEYAVCSNRGVCTNFEKCLCHPGWTGENCSLVVNGTFYIGEFGYSEQIKNYIWAYFKEIGIYNGPVFLNTNELRNHSQNEGKESSFKTVVLIIILGACIGLVFIALILFMICYRSKRVGKYRNGQNNGDFKPRDKFDNVDNFYHPEIGGRISGRKFSKKENDSRYESEITGNGKRRGRRHRRRSSNGSGHRRLCRDTGDGNESAGAISECGINDQDWNRCRPGGAQSDNDINNLTLSGKVNEELGNSIEKIIKFGSMPSYKEDKLNRSINNSPPSYPPGNNFTSEIDSGQLCRSSDPLLANLSTSCSTDVQSLLRSPGNTYSTQQPHSTISISTSFSNSPPLISSPEKKDLASLNAKLFSAQFGLPAPALFPNVPYTSSALPNISTSNPAQDKTFDVVFKQPEKGILKNKSSGDLKEINHNPKIHKAHHNCNSKKHKIKEQKLSNNDSNSVTSPSSGSQSSLSSCESNSSSCSPSSSSSSSGSSALSSLVTPPRNKKHNHKQKSLNRRSQNNPLPAPPTILCNASNQTEDLDNQLISSNSAVASNSNSQLQLLSNGEEDMEECDEEDCEECIKVRSCHANKSPPETLITSNSSAYDIVGSTDDGYHQYHSNNLRFNPDLSVHYDCHIMPTNRLPSNEEHSEQNSETEVDSHLQMLMNPPSNYFVSGGINNFMSSLPFPENGIYKETNPNNGKTHIPVMPSNQYPQYNNIGNQTYYYTPPPMTSSNILHENLESLENDDLASEVSISAYCRVPQTSNTKLLNDQVSRLNVPTSGLGSDRFSNTCFDGASNDGTIEGSDTSSLPDAHCDLVNLAQLGIGSSRPNPMLNHLVRGQINNRRGHDVTESCMSPPSHSAIWSPTRHDNRSPGHLPNPKSYPPGNDYVA